MARENFFKLFGLLLVPLCLAVFPIKVTACLFLAVLVLFTSIVIVASLHIFSKYKSESHTFQSLLQNYLFIILMWIFGWRARKRLESESKDCCKVQENLLMKMLANNKNTVYGREYNFESFKNSKDFMAVHPLTTKSHYTDYTERIAKGEDAVLTMEKTIKLAVTSGTTGPSCMIPRVPSQGYLAFLNMAASLNAMYEVYPETFNLQRILSFFVLKKEEITEGGIRKCPISNEPPRGSRLSIFSTPGPGFLITDCATASYVHLLFGLKDRNIGIIFTNLAEAIYRGFLALEDNWKQLVNDIEEGRICPDLELDAEKRRELNSYLKPDKKRAQELRKEFQAGLDGIAPRIWPNFRILLCVTTGSQELYAQKLRAKYTGHVPMYSAVYSSSETVFGVNLWPKEDPVYLPLLSAAFFEFIPYDHCHEEQPQTRLAEDLEVNCLYEIVVTTPGGLYRYRMGDIVKVARFHNKTPVLEFQHRRGQLFNSCHMTEKMVYSTLTTCVQSFDGKIQLEDYTCADSVLFDNLPESAAQVKKPLGSFHVIFAELSGILTAEETCLLEQKIDEALGNENTSHSRHQSSGEELATRLYRVKKGTFKKLRDYLMEANPSTSPIQFKTPRFITKKEAGDLLLANLHPQPVSGT